ncbi:MULTISPECIES: hypothetical protein [Methylomonas]|uniref:Uncharacterized protein n=2 Tax=Methylomonas TaxID=416 RepID=A0A140E4S7_9GAMM|nr:MULTISPECIES: hypothetical protein [Methylomonas]AMK75401.1 hypothetical protein JT25_002670 [Methylomonas denitrificans]OAI01189.1 hypothetical protein A1342_19245 [Methylomonas methanica]TCV78095.1 hypothetical protein EDE11_12614 [Methylomonas methanica]
MSIPNVNNLQNAFDAAQRANGILSLIFEGFIGSIPRKDVQQALYSVQQEIYEVLRIVEVLNWGDDMEVATVPDGSAEKQAVREEPHAGQSDLFHKLFRFAEIVTEEAVGIGTDLKKYRAAAVVNGSAAVLEAETEEASRPSRTSRSG